MSPGSTSSGAALADPGTFVLAAPVGATDNLSIIPEDIDMAALLADIQDDHVAAPADQVAGLREVVAHAKAEGYDVSFVVLPEAQPKFTYYRDIASQLQSETGGTVIVLGPNSVGSSSPYFSRVQQEEATDNLTLTNPPLAARQMFDQMTEPGVNWTLVTLVLLVVVVVGAVLARLRGLHISRNATTRDTSESASSPTVAAPSGPATVAAPPSDAEPSDADDASVESGGPGSDSRA
ncbi:Rv1476 family membrane protein [Gordonia soli]|uniref:Uncharacterized protein n=1 Tax=Gordonia soli NBRC 108243 TaxID=1223545 RepID=M0QJK2_9ACTN|nr:DUF6676 family protein [Gordonia soli]GAC68738.1 hypothetical protein GS4_18_00260 [Gordonia soli NBRC 108243]